MLETGLRQPEAIALYESHGYTPIPNYGFYRESPLSRCYRKPLVEPGRLEAARLGSTSNSTGSVSGPRNA